MTNSLIKTSSSWFLKPLHLKKNVSENGLTSNKRSEIHIFLPRLNDECSIRKFCPLAANHHLPDLCQTKKEQGEETTGQFDAVTVNRFEKHLEESHTGISGSSSEEEPSERTEDDSPSVNKFKKHVEDSYPVLSGSSSDEEPRERTKKNLPFVNKFEKHLKDSHLVIYGSSLEEELSDRTDNNLPLVNKFEKHLEESHSVISSLSSEKEPNERTEDNLPLVENVNKPEKSKGRLKVLHPNKVNYPPENMKLLLPDVVQNNKKVSPPSLTKNFCSGCINKGITLTKTNASNRNKFAKSKTIEQLEVRGSNQRFVTPVTFPPVSDTTSTTPTHIPKDNHKSSFNRNAQTNKLQDQRKDLKNNLKLPLPNPADKNVPRRRYNHKNSSNSPSGPWSISTDTESNSTPSIETGAADVASQSPHMVELSRLRKENLRIEEKMLLKQRQSKEIDRLRPPVNKWYEMKDQLFHHEAYRNNMYVKNQNSLPFIEDRRRLLYENIAVGNHANRR